VQTTSSYSQRKQITIIEEGFFPSSFLTLIKYYIMKKTQEKFVNKIYILKREVAPLSYILASQHSRRFPLLHFDEETGVNRPLRYARNQKSAFMDEQDGNAILEPIIFEDGFLNVQKENQVLQQFLSLHPGNGTVFSELDKAKEAQDLVDDMQVEIDALLAAREMDLETKLAVARVIFGAQVENMSTAEINRDVLYFAKNNPSNLLEILDDPNLEIESNIAQFISQGFLTVDPKSVSIKTGKAYRKLLGLPFGEDPMYILSSWMKSDEGLETYKSLCKKLKK